MIDKIIKEYFTKPITLFAFAVFLFILVGLNAFMNLNTENIENASVVKSTVTRYAPIIQSTPPPIDRAPEHKTIQPPAIIRDGLKTKYYKNGKVRSVTNYKDGKREGVSKSYFQSGSIEQEVMWAADKLNGQHKIHYADGQLKQEATFVNGIRDGLIRTFYESGELWIEEDYDYGKRIYTKRFNKKGELTYHKIY